ncbi:Zinc finger CCHC domain protein [Quillaja saponaria]|uniref:Zinc finger CCHC domain protein n=1 Tax=Quillaja saponaria TaxID=32244 RepID=A0AAD7PG30_QUISA|nr:Zinc finger CCHC domain protein [Quillaja saponaria]
MEETPLKRQREENQVEENGEEECKRHKSYNNILSLLESEEEEPTQDISSLITTLQQELSPTDCNFDTLLNSPPENDQNNPAIASSTSSLLLKDHNSSASSNFTSSAILKEDEEEEVDDKEMVMRHLLEASDDELGIPNKGYNGLVDHVELEDGFSVGGDGFGLGNRLWELEDETANYYTLLQSELFL